MKLRRSLLVAAAIAASPAIARADPTMKLDLGGGVSMDLVLVPKGTFTQGSPAGEPGREADERTREVKISEPYYLGKYPVTVGQFSRFATDARYRTEAESGASGGFGWDGKALVQKKEYTWRSPGFPQTDDHPVTLVSYQDAIAFTNWLTRASGRAVSLPTEAQWEHAYRAGTQGAYYQGSNEKDALDLGWFKANAGNGTRPVGQKKPNPWGLYDMAGNVFEWCSDVYATYLGGPLTDPRAAAPDMGDTARQVLRGGSWLKDPKHGRAAARYRNSAGSRNADNGFRVAVSTPRAPLPSPAKGAADTPPPPAPPPPSQPAKPAARAEDHDPGGMGVLAVTGTIALVLIAFVAYLVRRSAAGATGATGRGAGPNVRFRPGPDGFWILAPGSLRGAILHYRFQGATGPQEGQVTLEPSDVGQFVYTGAPPRAVEQIRLTAPESAPRRPQPARPQPARGPAPARSSSSRSTPGGAQQQHHHHDHHHHHHHHDPAPTDTSRDDEPFRGYPSAY